MLGEPVGGGDRQAAWERAFRLVHDVQVPVPGAASEITALAAMAEGKGWDEVARACLFGEAVAAWFAGGDGLSAALEALVERSSAEGDQVMLALGLAMRSDQGFSGHDPLAAARREADLARAVVLLEQTEGGSLDRISAHTACGIALCNRSFFELGDGQYLAALAVGEGEPPGSLDFILAPLVFNLAETQVSWASVLHQLGDEEGVANRWRAWKKVSTEGTSSFAMVEGWRFELEALGLLLGAMAGEDVAAEAGEMLEALPSEQVEEARSRGILLLAEALSDGRVGRPTGDEAAEAAIRALDPDVQPHLYDLALHLAAELAEGSGAEMGLRYARRQLEAHWMNRLSALGSLQSRIDAERLSAERELLSRHARLDDLTGIGNRRALEQYLGDLERREVGTISLVLLDLDAFKEVNDRFGHPAGDALLVAVARLLEGGIRPSDLAVRLGGDEFAVVLADAGLDVARARALELLASCDQHPFEEVGPGLVVTLSAGVASGSPARLAELFAEADLALYRAKAGEGQQAFRSRLASAIPEEPLRL